MTAPVRRTLSRQGRRFNDGLIELGDQFVFYARSLAAIPKTIRLYWQQVLVLISDISFGTASMIAAGGTVGVVFGMSFITSAQVAIEGSRGLGLIGLTPLAGLLGSVVNTRELAPLVASIALAAKVGTGFTAQLGAMRISDEVAALESMAVRSLRFLVATRILAALISVLPLYLLGLFASYAASYLSIVVLGNQSSGTYDYFFQLMLTPSDVLLSVSKALIFAVIVTLVHCYYGYTATGGPEGVGRAAGRALRTSLVTLVIIDLILAFAFYGIPPRLPGIGVG